MNTTLTSAIAQVLNTANPRDKVTLSREIARRWNSGAIVEIGATPPPEQPPCPDVPLLIPPSQMKKRAKGSPEGRAAFVHAIAHIEFVAINLAWDMVARFVQEKLPHEFYDDWISVACDETRHFCLLADRLTELGYQYGDFPAHNGLWEAAETTADDVLARLAIVPMVLEARGLDTTPKAVSDLRAARDNATADLMETIGREEVPHVQSGVKWFEFICNRRELEPVSTFHSIVAHRLKGQLRPPFNREMRHQAGLTEAYYDPVPVT